MWDFVWVGLGVGLGVEGCVPVADGPVEVAEFDGVVEGAGEAHVGGSEI